MNQRIVSIINYLTADRKISLDQLSQYYHVSKRTLRNDINSINLLLIENGLYPISFDRERVIRQSDFGQLIQLIPGQDLYSYKLSREERSFLAASILVSSSDYITLSMIAEYLYVSRATIIKDLDLIKQILAAADLELISYPNKGLWVQGKESLKRKFILGLIQKEQIFLPKDEKGNARFSLQAGNVVTIRKIVTEQEKLHGSHLTEESYQLITDYIRVMIQRNKQGEYMERLGHGPIGKRYRMAQDILKYISQYCNITSTEDEIFFLGKMLEEVRYLKQKEFTDRNTIKIQLLTRKLIENVSEELDINLSDDYDFYENLSNHLHSMFHNKTSYLPHNNTFRDIVQNNRDVLAAVKKHVRLFLPYIKREIEEIELAYITIHICAAIERKKNKDVAFHVVLACNGGIGTSQLLLARLKKHFNFKVVDIVSSHEAVLITPEQADLIISTVPLKECQTEHIVISPLLNDEDYIRVGSKIDTIRNSRHLPIRKEKKEITVNGIIKTVKPVIHKYLSEAGKPCMEEIKLCLENYLGEKDTGDVFSPYLHHLLTADFVALDVECSDWREAVKRSAEMLLKKGYIEERYIDAMIRNIKENGPYVVISEGFAFPHEGLEMGTLKLGMSLIRLKTPIPFGDDEFDPVEFVCCLSAVDQKSHLKAFFHLVNMLQNKEFKKALREAVDAEAVAGIIERYEYMMEI
ncbi:BglG family transcription antiterminator [Clostridium sp. Marseille-P2415]|uniref:BglG family transcription antiterminator n=1 Tax=Clostridium sp. Marseille-P2415 TaxID=1805471 RepID=UPI00098879FC|nr:PTS sugar transporter subunit IIA [Clostridium sp. Marseille-P2415]